MFGNKNNDSENHSMTRADLKRSQKKEESGETEDQELRHTDHFNSNNEIPKERPSFWERHENEVDSQESQRTKPSEYRHLVDEVKDEIDDKGLDVSQRGERDTPEYKHKKLAHRLDLVIVTLIILIVIVFLILRFVG